MHSAGIGCICLEQNIPRLSGIVLIYANLSPDRLFFGQERYFRAVFTACFFTCFTRLNTTSSVADIMYFFLRSTVCMFKVYAVRMFVLLLSF